MRGMQDVWRDGAPNGAGQGILRLPIMGNNFAERGIASSMPRKRVITPNERERCGARMAMSSYNN